LRRYSLLSQAYRSCAADGKKNPKVDGENIHGMAGVDFSVAYCKQEAGSIADDER